MILEFTKAPLMRSFGWGGMGEKSEHEIRTLGDPKEHEQAREVIDELYPSSEWLGSQSLHKISRIDRYCVCDASVVTPTTYSVQ